MFLFGDCLNVQQLNKDILVVEVLISYSCIKNHQLENSNHLMLNLNKKISYILDIVIIKIINLPSVKFSDFDNCVSIFTVIRAISSSKHLFESVSRCG